MSASLGNTREKSSPPRSLFTPTRRTLAAALPHQPLGGRSRQEKWILKSELFNEIYKVVIRNRKFFDEQFSSAPITFTLWSGLLKAVRDVMHSVWGDNERYMFTRDVTLKALISVFGDLIRNKNVFQLGREARDRVVHRHHASLGRDERGNFARRDSPSASPQGTGRARPPHSLKRSQAIGYKGGRGRPVASCLSPISRLLGEFGRRKSDLCVLVLR